MEALEFLRQCPPFDLLDEVDLERIAESLECIEAPAGSELLLEGGDPSRYLMVLRSGQVTLSKGGEIRRVLEPGDLFGYPSILAGTAPALDVTVSSNASICRIPEATFRGLLEVASFADYFLKSLGERLRIVSTASKLTEDGNLAAPVKDLVKRSPLFVESSATVQEAARVMLEAKTSSTLVAGDPIGIVTDRDLSRRVLARGLGPTTQVAEVMSIPVKSMDSDATAAAALLFMLQEEIHHLVLVEEGEAVGVITSTDLLRHQSRNPVYLQRRLLRAHDPKELAGYTDRLTQTVRTLVRGGLGIIEISRIVSSLNDALVQRLLVLAEKRLGPPPTPYAWIVFGSEGRQEQALVTDQDNALVDGEASPESDRYFDSLTKLVGEGLATAGFPPCQGGYTADRWHKRLADWEGLFRGWIETPDPEALMDAANFFDFRPVYGELSLESLEEVVAGAGGQSVFLGRMVREAEGFGVPLNLFNRIRTDEEGSVDLKSGGIAPIVGLARTLSLSAGSRERSTLERLRVAARSGTLSRDDAEALAETLRLLMRLRLREQLRSISVGKTPTNKVVWKELSALEQRHLREGLVALRQVQSGVGSRFGTKAMA
jgi:CBS domain-containing protein